MFNLDQAIAEWRRQMIAGKIKSAEVLDELESHVREDAERKIRSGMNPPQAFEASVRAIGRGDTLKAEFAKVEGFTEARAGKLIGIALSVLTTGFALMATPAFFTIREMTLGQRLVGLAAVAAIFFAIMSWRFNHIYLPVIRNRRLRMAAGIVCSLAGVLWLFAFGGILIHIIVPRILGAASATRENFFPVFAIGISFLWAVAVAAALGSIAYGLEEAARRQHRKETYV